MIARHTTVQRVAQHMRQHSTCITAGPASNGHKVCVEWTTACRLITMEGCTCRLATACRFTCDYCWCGHQQRTQSSCIPPPFNPLTPPPQFLPVRPSWHNRLHSFPHTPAAAAPVPYRCSMVLPCTTTAAAPACCSRRTTLGAFSFFSDSPAGQATNSRPNMNVACQPAGQ